jgi:hypothetical protein
MLAMPARASTMVLISLGVMVRRPRTVIALGTRI